MIAFCGPFVPAKTSNDFKLTALLCFIKSSSIKAIISSSKICFFLSAKSLNLVKALLINSSSKFG